MEKNSAPKNGVAVLGASANPEKYSYLAVRLLKDKGYPVFPVNPALKKIEEISVYPSLLEIPEPIDTISVYLNAKISSELSADILAVRPRRVIFNPGAENTALLNELKKSGIQTLEACTLVMLKTSQF